MTDTLIKDLVFLTQWGRMVGTQGMCVSVPLERAPTVFVCMKLLPHPVASERRLRGAPRQGAQATRNCWAEDTGRERKHAKAALSLCPFYL